MSSRLKKVRVVLLALVCLAGCTSELARQETADRQRSEVARQEEWRAWSKAMNTWDPNVGEEFLERYPDSVDRLRVQEHIDELHAQAKDRPTYEPYVQKNTIEGYREFLAQYPHNAFVPEAQAQIAELEELEYAPYRNLNTISSYQEFLRRYPNHKYTQDARERLELLQHPPQSSSRTTFSRPSEVLVTPGDIGGQKYTILGSVEWPAKDTIVVTFFGSSDCNPDRLRKAAWERYGSLDAVIGYTTWHDGFRMHCSGTAVKFVTTPPEPPGTDFQQGGKQERSAEERLKEMRQLLDQKLITPGEYERKRLEILKEL